MRPSSFSTPASAKISRLAGVPIISAVAVAAVRFGLRRALRLVKSEADDAISQSTENAMRARGLKP